MLMLPLFGSPVLPLGKEERFDTQPGYGHRGGGVPFRAWHRTSDTAGIAIGGLGGRLPSVSIVSRPANYSATGLSQNSIWIQWRGGMGQTQGLDNRDGGHCWRRLRRPAKGQLGRVFRIGHPEPEAVIDRRHSCRTCRCKSFYFNHGQRHSLWHGNCNIVV
jgi:hypothetical protein